MALALAGAAHGMKKTPNQHQGHQKEHHDHAGIPHYQSNIRSPITFT
jgi:hypothetical protein